MKKFIMAILVAIISTSSVMGAVWSQDYVQHTGASSTVKVPYKYGYCEYATAPRFCESYL